MTGANVMSLALIVVVTWQMARTTLVDPVSVALAASSALLLFTTRLKSIWLIAAGAAVGLARAL